MESPKFFGLLHLAIGENSAINVKVKDFENQIKIYLQNAFLLSKSLEAQNLEFILLTNDKKTLLKLLGPSQNLQIEEIPFETVIPTGTRFYSAHLKIDVFRFISKLNYQYAIFCDLDVVCICTLPKVFETIILERIPLVYDITDQVIPGDGHATIIKNLEKIHSMKSEGRWFGGEFLAGHPEFFKHLVSEIDNILPAYFSQMANGSIVAGGNDEFYTTSALEVLKRKNAILVSDGGPLNIVGRYWSSGTGYVQKPFQYFENVFLLHLPADKKFLAQQAIKIDSFNSQIFLNEYKKYLKIKKIKGIPNEIIYFLFRIKSKIVFLRSNQVSKISKQQISQNCIPRSD